MGTNTISFCLTLLLSAFLLIHSNLYHGVGFAQDIARSEREALEIIIGGGGDAPAPSPEQGPECGGCYQPPPPEPECPPPPSPPPPPPPPSPPPPPPPPSPPPPSPSPPPPSPPPPPRSPPPPPPSPPPPPRSPPPPPPSPPPPPPSPPPLIDTRPLLERARKTLINFKSIIEPNDFTRNWQGDDVCKYRGVRCDKFPKGNGNATSGLDFNGAGFKGKNQTTLKLTGILDKIPELTFFHVNSNNFSELVPSEITKFKFFYELDLSNNKNRGEFPPAVIDAKQLVFLDLRFNNYNGTVPPQLFQKDLDVIFINNNRFSGYLPENFGSTPARYLTFANNRFTGPIPSSIGQASKTLTEVLFLGNQFSGCLPYEIGKLKKLTVFDVSKNQLRGPIPHSFICLDSIQLLNLANNKFSGTVPEMLCKLSGLRNNGILDLRNNYFTQVGPECKKLMASGVLKVDNNCILGVNNQRPAAKCNQFFSSNKPCPNAKSFYKVPCGKNYYSTVTQTADLPPTAAPPAPVTYKSLKPHRL